MNSPELRRTELQSTAIAVFVKTPRLSPVKTRLAASIGTPNAEQLYRLCIGAIEQTLDTTLKNLNATPFWAVGEVLGEEEEGEEDGCVW